MPPKRPMAIPSITPEIRAFLEEMRVPCVISTLRPDGAPITSATWFGFLGDDVVVSTPAQRNKARNVRNDPRVSFIVDTKTNPVQGVAIEGVVEVLEDDDDAILGSIVARYLGADAAAEMLQRLSAMRGQRVILRIRPSRVRPWAIPAPMPPSAGEGVEARD